MRSLNKIAAKRATNSIEKTLAGSAGAVGATLCLGVLVRLPKIARTHRENQETFIYCVVHISCDG